MGVVGTDDRRRGGHDGDRRGGPAGRERPGSPDPRGGAHLAAPLPRGTSSRRRGTGSYVPLRAGHGSRSGHRRHVSLDAKKGGAPSPETEVSEPRGSHSFEDPPPRPPVSLPLPLSDDAALRIAPGGGAAFRARSALLRCLTPPGPLRIAARRSDRVVDPFTAFVRFGQPLRGSVSGACAPSSSPLRSGVPARRGPSCLARFRRSRGIFQLTGFSPDFLRSSPGSPRSAQGTGCSSTVHPHDCAQAGAIARTAPSASVTPSTRVGSGCATDHA